MELRNHPDNDAHIQCAQAMIQAIPEGTTNGDILTALGIIVTESLETMPGPIQAAWVACLIRALTAVNANKQGGPPSLN